MQILVNSLFCFASILILDNYGWFNATTVQKNNNDLSQVIIMTHAYKNNYLIMTHDTTNKELVQFNCPFTRKEVIY